jgi:predicted unusual protein kinase regulating ubiquinone biosynthesis (AarF/ABC1/UbiB family)
MPSGKPGMIQTFSNFERSIKIFYIGLHHLFAHFLRLQAARVPLLRRINFGAALSGPQRLRIALEQIGGTFIKFGQVLALQSDILPLDYCRELFNLLDRVPPFAFADVEQTFVEDFGRKPSQIFDSFAREALATGSIGQVHVATLGHKKLAVKVRRPSVLTDFGADIRLMAFTIRAITVFRVKQLYWMIAPTTEFIAWTREEMDYRNEARYMDMIAKNAANNPREQVPRVLWEHTTERILTAEFLEALTVLDYMRARESCNQPVLEHFHAIDFEPDLFARNLIDNFLGDAFQYGMFHADLHPANLLILPSSRVGYIDFGIAGVLSAYSRHHLIAMTLAYTRGDLGGMCESFFQVSAMDGHSDQIKFRSHLRELSLAWYSRDGEDVVLRKSITAIMLDLLTLSRATGIWPQRDVVKYIRSAIALDGLIKSFAPGFDVGRHLEAVCDRHMQWHAMQTAFSARSIFAWFEANSALVRDGATRTLRAIDRLAPSRERTEKAPLRPNNPVTVRTAAVALAASLLAEAPQSPLVWGANVRSAAVGLAIASGIITVWKMLRQNGGPSAISS